MIWFEKKEVIGSTGAEPGITNTSRDTATKVMQDPLLAISRARQQQAIEKLRLQIIAQRRETRDATQKEARSRRHHRHSRLPSSTSLARKSRSRRDHDHTRHSPRIHVVMSTIAGMYQGLVRSLRIILGRHSASTIVTTAWRHLRRCARRCVGLGL
jgi:hypothetical protein